MQPTLCSRCKKNIATVFITRMEGDKTINEGLCLKCAKSLGLPQVNDMMQRMGITDEDLDNLNNEMMQAMDSIDNVEDLPGGEDDFSYHRFDGAELDFQALADAVDAVPFLTERTLIEVRGFDTNKCREEEAQALVRVIGDLPDYCTLVFLMSTDFEPDGRLKTTKAFKKYGELIQFTAQGESALVRWVGKRFAAHKKHISPEDARQLIFFTGGLMNSMIPEIDKIAAYVSSDTVTRADILAVAHRLPEAVAYELTDRLADQDYDGAMRILADLLADKANTPIFLLAVIGQQMRRLYAARLARHAGLGTGDLRALLGLPYDFIAENLLRSARKFSGRQLEEAVRLCAQADFAMKNTGADDAELLKELLLRIAVGGAA